MSRREAIQFAARLSLPARHVEIKFITEAQPHD